MNYKLKQIRTLILITLLGVSTLSISVFSKDTEKLRNDITVNKSVSFNENIIKELIKDNIHFLSGPNKKLSTADIENIAYKQFIYYRKHGSLIGANFRQLQKPILNRGVINFYSKGQAVFSLREKTKEYSTNIYVDENGNFSVSLGGNNEYLNGADVKAKWAGTVVGERRKDGYYNVYVVQASYKGENIVEQHICDSRGNTVNQGVIRQRSQNYLQKELDKIQYLSDVNKSLLSSVLAGNDIYDIDYVQKDGIQTIYADKLDRNIEIRFVKTDASIIYGVYIVSFNPGDQVQETNSGSEIYAFKYLDESTSKTPRVKLMTKQVVQYNFNEQYPSTQKYTTGTKGNEKKLTEEFTHKTGGLFNRKITKTTSQQLKSIYENFMCEGVTYTIYTKDDEGRFYKNQQEMF